MTAPPTAYIETCIVSGLAKGDLPSSTTEAVLRILQFRSCGLVSVVTSSVTKSEIDRIPEKHRTPHQAIYSRLLDLPIAQEFQTDSGLLLLGVGGRLRIDPLFSSIKAILPDENARHVFQAARNGATYFVTADHSTILKYRDQIGKNC